MILSVSPLGLVIRLVNEITTWLSFFSCRGVISGSNIVTRLSDNGHRYYQNYSFESSSTFDDFLRMNFSGHLIVLNKGAILQKSRLVLI